MTTFRPLQDRVLIKRVDAAARTQSGLFLPDSAQEKPQQGKVIAVGEGTRNGDTLTPPTVKIGDTVIFGKFTGEKIQLDGEEHLILRESDLLGIVQ